MTEPLAERIEAIAQRLRDFPNSDHEAFEASRKLREIARLLRAPDPEVLQLRQCVEALRPTHENAERLAREQFRWQLPSMTWEARPEPERAARITQTLHWLEIINATLNQGNASTDDPARQAGASHEQG